MLLQTLRADWDARRTNVRIAPLPEFIGGVLTIGAGTKLSSLSAQNREAEADRAIALLSVALGRPLEATAAAHARRALDKARDGDVPLALIHLALAGVGRLDDPREDARRLSIADGLMKGGVAPSVIIAALGDAASPSNELNRAYNPD
jgi:hypothetical protein